MSKKIKIVLIIISGILLALSLGFGVFLMCNKDNFKLRNLQFTIKEENSSIIYTPISHGYRYGPAIIKTAENRYEALFSTWPETYRATCSDIGPSCADVLTYRVSDDGGKTWSEEVLSMIPEEGSLDRFSVCDPSFIKVGDWYYCAYTSTFDNSAGGVYNWIYCARTKTPTNYKSWEKWNGSGWSAFGACDYQPIIRYTESSKHYGIGEPSMLVKDGEIYVYYTFVGNDFNGKICQESRLAKAPMSENWCKDLVDVQVVMKDKRTENSNEDSIDVKYIDELDMFLAVSINNRMAENSYVKMAVSDDGINFRECVGDNTASYAWAHNVGVSGDSLGHMSLDDENFVSYAFGRADGDNWGKWQTALQFFSVNVVEDNKLSNVFRKDIKDDELNKSVKAWSSSNIVDSDPLAVDYQASNVLEDGANKFFMSATHTQKTYYEYVAIRTNGSFSKIEITPCFKGEGFPSIFSFEYSDDGRRWEKIEGARYDYTSTPVLNDNALIFDFNQVITAKFVRFITEELTEVGGLYLLQLSRMKIID